MAQLKSPGFHLRYRHLGLCSYFNSVLAVVFETFAELVLFPAFGVQNIPTISAMADLMVVCSRAENCTEAIPVMVIVQSTLRGRLAL